MLNLEKFHSLRECLRKITVNKKETVFVKYDFPAGHVMRKHYHLDNGHWIVFIFGKFEIELDEKQFELLEPWEGVSAIYIPKTHVHRVKCLEDGCYIVFRDGPSETIYLESDEEAKNPESFDLPANTFQ